jgi:hypothetical protein
MSDMVKYRAVSFKKDQIAALYFPMSDMVKSVKYKGSELSKRPKSGPVFHHV